MSLMRIALLPDSSCFPKGRNLAIDGFSRSFHQTKYEVYPLERLVGRFKGEERHKLS